MTAARRYRSGWPTVCGTLLLACLLPSTLSSTPANEEEAAPLPEGIEATYEESQKITWYAPRLDRWEVFDVRVSPVIGKSDRGERKIGLRIAIKDPPVREPRTLQVVVDGETYLAPISPSENLGRRPSRCHVTQTLFLQNQETMLRAVAGARSAELILVGYARKLRHKLTDEDLENFRKMVALWDRPDLPSAPPRYAQPPAPEGVYRAGVDGIANPRIIPETKVTPRFPREASARGLKGDVVLQVVVRKDGTLDDIEVLRPAIGDCGFEAAAIEAVRGWRYEPATKDGEPVDAWFTIVVTFTYP